MNEIIKCLRDSVDCGKTKNLGTVCLRAALVVIYLSQVISQAALITDSQAAINDAEYRRITRLRKFIDWMVHHIKHPIYYKKIILLLVPSQENQADVFTKPLLAPRLLLLSCIARNRSNLHQEHPGILVRFSSVDLLLGGGASSLLLVLFSIRTMSVRSGSFTCTNVHSFCIKCLSPDTS